MYPFVESLKFIDCIHYNLEYHQARFDLTRSVHYPGTKRIKLEEVLGNCSGLLPNQLYKCRIIYGETISDVIYEPYTPRHIHQYYLLVCPNELDYSFKTTNRAFFDNARTKLNNNEDFIYVRKGLITDTSYANLVFTDGAGYFTPSCPLLKGTKRAYYLQHGLIKEEEIRVSDLSKFKSFFAINAMLDLVAAPTFSCNKLLLSHNYLKL